MLNVYQSRIPKFLGCSMEQLGTPAPFRTSAGSYLRLGDGSNQSHPAALLFAVLFLAYVTPSIAN